MIPGITKSILNYRGFILGTVKREFQVKYSNSVLGVSWTLLNPLAMIVIYTVVFSQLMKARLPGNDSAFAYSIYLCAGVLTWGLFAEIVSRGQNVFIEHANLMKKMSFPRICLPVVVVLNALVNFAVIFGIFTAFLVLSGNFPGWTYLALVPVLLLEVALAIGLGIILGILNVFFRDVGQFFGIALQFWFWFTPIIYPASVLPEAVRDTMPYVNPMAPIIGAYQAILSNGHLPDWSSLAIPGAVALLLCLAGVRLFLHRAGEMVDEL